MNSSSRVLLCNVDGAQVLRMLTRLVNYLTGTGTKLEHKDVWEKWKQNRNPPQGCSCCKELATSQKMKFTNAQMIEEKILDLMVVVSSCCEMVVVHPSDTL